MVTSLNSHMSHFTTTLSKPLLNHWMILNWQHCVLGGMGMGIHCIVLFYILSSSFRQIFSDIIDDDEGDEEEDSVMVLMKAQAAARRATTSTI